MRTYLVRGLGLCCLLVGVAATERAPIQTAGRLQSEGSAILLWWALSSRAKIRPDTAPPEQSATAIQIRCARNESESVQLLLRPEMALRHFTVETGALFGAGQTQFEPNQIEVLQAVYLIVTRPSDKSTRAGLWPDPLVPVRSSLELGPGPNHIFWIRLNVPRGAAGGVYRGALRLRADGWQAEVLMELKVYDFSLPDQMTCQTRFGFSPGEVFRYHRLNEEPAKRAVLEKYWADLSAHHISPYDPAPLDPFQVAWPDVENLR